MGPFSVRGLWSTYLSRLEHLNFEKSQTNTLRGIAAIAVVWHHCMLYYARTLDELQIDPFFISNTLIKYPSVLLDPVRMPLFTILSGCVYALMPVSPQGNTGKFVSGKVRRIIIPFLFLSTVMYFDTYLFSGAYPTLHIGNEETDIHPGFFWMTWFFHFGHLWFLQSLFVIFMVILLIDYRGWMNSLRHWILWLMAFAILPLVVPYTSFLSLGGTENLLFFFIFGVGIRRFSTEIFIPKTIIVSWLLLAVSMTFHVFGKLELIPIAKSTFEYRVLSVTSGACAAICLFSLQFSIKWLASIGNYSYSIYLYHALVMHHIAFYSMLSHSAASASLWFVMVIICSIIAPILIEKLFIQVPYFRTLVLGKKNSSQPG